MYMATIYNFCGEIQGTRSRSAHKCSNNFVSSSRRTDPGPCEGAMHRPSLHSVSLKILLTLKVTRMC